MIVLVILLLFMQAAYGQPAMCVPSAQSWSQQYTQGTVQSIAYYQDQQFLAATMMPGTIPKLHVHAGVPLSIAMRFQGMKDATSFYNSAIKGHYLEACLAETGCPLLVDGTGDLMLCTGNSPVRCAPPCLLGEDGSILVDETGVPCLAQETLPPWCH
jgi:hypothetical protein